MNKKQLYAYCILHKDLNEVLEMRIKTSQTLKLKELRVKKRSPSVSKWNQCVSSRLDAKNCVNRLIEKYPSLFKEFCEPIVEGPAAGLIVEGKKVVGIVTPEGELLAVEGVISVPVPPIPPPMPKVPIPPPILKISTIPRVEIPKAPSAKKALKKDLSEARAGNLTVNVRELKKQFLNLRKVQQKEIAKQHTAYTTEGANIAALLSVIKKHKAAAISTIETRLEIEREKTRLHLQALREKEDPREAIKAAVKRGVKLRKATRCTDGQIYDGTKKRCVECSEYGLVYDPRIKRCVAVKIDVTKSIGKQVFQPAVEGGIDEILAEMEEEREEATLCIII